MTNPAMVKQMKEDAAPRIRHIQGISDGKTLASTNHHKDVWCFTITDHKFEDFHPSFMKKLKQLSRTEEGKNIYTIRI